MSNAGPGLAPNKQAVSGKVAAVDGAGDKVSAGYIKRDNDMFKTSQPKAPALASGSGGSKGTGGRGREAQNVGKYTPPKWP
jgi:hypothetical protein